MGREKSAGFLIFRRVNSQIEYLLLKATEMGKFWTPPKGILITLNQLKYSNSNEKSTIGCNRSC